MSAPSHTDSWSIDASEFSADARIEKQLAFLVRYAILAASSHNTQPWRFEIEKNKVDIFADDGRWLKVADADKRELFISVGCALENLLVAAERFGFTCDVEHTPTSKNELHAASVSFQRQSEPVHVHGRDLFEAITARHTNHQKYDERTIPPEQLDRLAACCTEDDLSLSLITDETVKDQFDDLVIRGDTIQFANPAFRQELAYWVGQGVFGTSWFMSKLGQLAVAHLNLGSSRAKKDSAVLMSSPVFGVIASKANDRRSQIRVGQLFERVCLTATAAGIWTQPMSQVVEVPELKQRLAALACPREYTPQHPFRMGFAKPEPHTPRRPIEEVIA